MENKNIETICSEELMKLNGGELIQDILGAAGTAVGYYGKIFKDGVQACNGYIPSNSIYGA